jgi:hypothetical protein
MTILQSRVFRLSALWLGLVALCTLAPAAAAVSDPASDLSSLLRAVRAEAAASGERLRLHLPPPGSPLAAELRRPDGRIERRLLRTDVILLRAPEWIDFSPTGTLSLPAGHRKPAPSAFASFPDSSPHQDLVFDAESHRVLIDFDHPSGRIHRLSRLRRSPPLIPSLWERLQDLLRFGRRR